MASFNLGRFAGAAADSFNAAKKRQEDEKARKLQAKLFEANLKRMQDQITAETTLADILTGTFVDEFQPTNPNFVKSQEPVIPDATSDPRIEPTAPIERREVPGFRSAGAEGPLTVADILAGETPGAQVGQAAALQSGQLKFGDFASSGRQPKELDLLQAINVSPTSEEGRKAILASMGAGESADAATQLALNIQEEMLDEKRTERLANEKTERAGVIGRKQSIRNDFNNNKRIIELQEKLEGTLVSTGTSINEFIRKWGGGVVGILDIAGMDVQTAQTLFDDFDELTKLFADGTIEALDRFKETGAVQQLKFQKLTEAAQELGKTSIANGRVAANQMQEVLDAADRQGEPVEGRAEIEAWIKEMKTRVRGESSGADVTTILSDMSNGFRDFSKITLEQLREIPDSELSAAIKQMSVEQRAKFQQLITELSK